jgi:hypothetical protein
MSKKKKKAGRKIGIKPTKKRTKNKSQKYKKSYLVKK